VKSFKDLFKKLLWILIRDKDGFSKLRVIKGPAKNVVLYLDVRKEGSYWIGTYDRWILERVELDKIIQPHWVVWDCGAYVGYYTAIFRKIVGPLGKVYSFEASKINYERLQRLPTNNNWSNVFTHHKAIGPDHSQIKFISNLGGASGPAELSRVIAKDEEWSFEFVQSCGVDELVAEHDIAAPDFIKFDIESAEEFALKNGDRIFSTQRPILLLEIHNKTCLDATGLFIEKYKYRAKDVYNFKIESVPWFVNYKDLNELTYLPHMLYCTPD